MTFMSDMTYGGIYAEPGNHAFREIVRYTIALHVINAHVIEVTENAKLHCSTHTTRTSSHLRAQVKRLLNMWTFSLNNKHVSFISLMNSLMSIMHYTYMKQVIVIYAFTYRDICLFHHTMILIQKIMNAT